MSCPPESVLQDCFRVYAVNYLRATPRQRLRVDGWNGVAGALVIPTVAVKGMDYVRFCQRPRRWICKWFWMAVTAGKGFERVC